MVADPPEFTTPTSPSLARRAIPHVDGAAWPCRLRVAPSQTSPGSTIKSRNPSFEGPAPRDRPLRRGIISPGHAGKRRNGFTRRLLALHVARLSSGRGLASLPSPPPKCIRLCGLKIVYGFYLVETGPSPDSSPQPDASVNFKRMPLFRGHIWAVPND